MRISDLTSYLEILAPLGSQEEYDNCGLIVGEANAELTGALISLDCTEEIIDEAIAKGCNLVISHHPIVFRGLKKFNGKNYVERTVIKAIQNKVALYAIHTNLDNYRKGVNHHMSNLLGLKNQRILAPKSNVLSKLIFYSPVVNKESILSALYKAGAGQIGQYAECSFSVEGEGTFLPNLDANPYSGEKGKLSREKEARVEVLVSHHIQNRVVQVLKQVHPYEEVAYELISLQNVNPEEGAGRIGTLETPMEEKDFLQQIKSTFGCGSIRHTAFLNKKIKTVALCGGSGSFLLGAAKANQADIYITADYKYHEFFDAEGQIMIADIGHYESEQFTTNLLADILTKKFPKFALHLTGTNTNPIKYF